MSFRSTSSAAGIRPQGYVRNKYTAAEIDLIAAHCHELRRNYLIPFDRVAEGKEWHPASTDASQEWAEGVDTLRSSITNSLGL